MGRMEDELGALAVKIGVVCAIIYIVAMIVLRIFLFSCALFSVAGLVWGVGLYIFGLKNVWSNFGQLRQVEKSSRVLLYVRILSAAIHLADTQLNMNLNREDPREYLNPGDEQRPWGRWGFVALASWPFWIRGLAMPVYLLLVTFVKMAFLFCFLLSLPFVLFVFV